MIQMELASERLLRARRPSKDGSLPSPLPTSQASPVSSPSMTSRRCAVGRCCERRSWQPHMERHGGRVAEMAGDAVLVEFASVVNAVRWAADVQRAQQRGLGEPDPIALQLRIGINVEDVIDDDGVLQGDGVNIAARIHQAAEPGQIVVTAAVRDYVINRLPVRVPRSGHAADEEYQSTCSRVCGRVGRRWEKRPGRAALPAVVVTSDGRGAAVPDHRGDRGRQLLRRRHHR